MGRILPADEWVRRHAESALISAIRLRRYWLSRGRPESEAIEKAVKQAIGMMASSGLEPEKLLELFRDHRRACDAFIKMLERVVRERRA